MDLLVYNGEVYNRWKWWYICFIAIFSFLSFLFLVLGNLQWVLLICFLLGGYISFSLTTFKKIKISLTEQWIMLNQRLFQWQEVYGYSVWIDKNNKVSTLILFLPIGKVINTIVEQENVNKQFFSVLDGNVNYVQDSSPTLLEGLVRKLKI